jgi:hypothetical protein
MFRRMAASTRRLAGIAAAVGILGVVEVGLRVLGLPAAEPRARFVNEEAERAHAGIDFVGDDELFWRLPPSRFVVGGAYRTNRLGLRGPEVRRPKPAGVFRVAVVGDSCAFGLGLDLPDTFGARLEALRGPGRERVEVVRVAVPGYSSLQSLVLARRMLPALGADATVLWVGAFNDAAPACGASDARLAAAGRSRVLPVLRRLALFRAIGSAVRGAPPECPPKGPHPAPRVSLTELRANLAALGRLGREANGRVVTLVPPVVSGARAVPYARLVRKLAGAVDPALGPDGFQADRIHPNRTGDVAVARVLARALGLQGQIDPRALLDARRADRAVASVADGEAALALPILAELLPRASDRPLLLAAHADALAALGRWDDSRAAADQALRLHQGFTELRRIAAEARAATGDEAGAIRELRTALAQDRGWIAGRVALARILLAKGDRAAARTEIDRGLRLAPESPELRRLAAEL